MANAERPRVPRGYLPRLAPESYRGRAVVMWTLTTKNRARLPLDHAFHSSLREFQLHVAAREHLLVPAYTVMPDHAHLVWMGTRDDSDLRRGMVFFRTHVSGLLATAGIEFQHQPHDHVLDETERKRGAFMTACTYVLQNPVRAAFCNEPKDWPFCGCVVPGYPNFHPCNERFWEQFWEIYNRVINGGSLVDRALTNEDPAS